MFYFNTLKGYLNSLYNAYDSFTQGIKQISTDHDYIHEGIGYCLHHFTASLTFGSVLKYRFVSPEFLYCHIKDIQAACEGGTIKVTLKRRVTITGNGTQVENAIQNLNDNVDEVGSLSKLYNGSVTYSDSVDWCSIVVNGSTTNQSSSNGSFSQSENMEYVTKNNNTEYIIEIENIDEAEDASSNIFLNVFFYEESQGLSA